MNENEMQLLEGLRALAQMEPREASARVEQTLRATFRARAERRRRTVVASGAAALLAIAAAIVVLFFAPITWHRNAPAPQEASEVAAANVPDAQYALVRTDDLASSFYPLPEADDLPPVETTLVVRVQLPPSSLQLMGFPVSEDAGADPVQAELLLGQDGMARGVRLIQ